MQTEPTDPSAPASECDTCGAPDAHAIAGRLLCLDCYSLMGSCCAGSDDDDEPSKRSDHLHH